MLWAIQDSLHFESLDRNVKPLVETLRRLARPFVAVGVIPKIESIDPVDSEIIGVDECDLPKITGLEDLDRSKPTIFYGSTLLAELGVKSGFTPGSFYSPDWWNPKIWAENRPDMLNTQVNIISMADLRDNWVQRPTFIKPVDPKKFSGQVIEGVEREEWLGEHIHLPDDLKLAISPISQIEREWRFFIVNGRLITGSLYKRYGCLVIREPIPDSIYKSAEKMASGWLPFHTIVMDICELKSGELKVLEFNSINSSGFYNSNIADIVVALDGI